MKGDLGHSTPVPITAKTNESLLSTNATFLHLKVRCLWWCLFFGLLFNSILDTDRVDSVPKLKSYGRLHNAHEYFHCLTVSIYLREKVKWLTGHLARESFPNQHGLSGMYLNPRFFVSQLLVMTTFAQPYIHNLKDVILMIEEQYHECYMKLNCSCFLSSSFTMPCTWCVLSFPFYFLAHLLYVKRHFSVTLIIFLSTLDYYVCKTTPFRHFSNIPFHTRILCM